VPSSGILQPSEQESFFDQLLGDRNLQKILNVALSIEHNPVARYLAERTPCPRSIGDITQAWAIICPRPIIGM